MARRPTPEHERRRLSEQLRAVEDDIEAVRKLAHGVEPGTGTHLDFHHRTGHPVHGEEVELADGARIVVRPVEPSDLHELEQEYEQLGALSRYRRAPGQVRRPSMKQLKALTEVDHRAAEVLVAFDPHDGAAVGMAHYARDPDAGENAEFDCTVLDAWQRRGVGTALAERLAEGAAAAGIGRLTARMVPEDEPARRLAAHIAEDLAEERDGDAMAMSGRLRATRR